MSMNKRLQHELANNPRAEAARIEDLEAEKTLRQEILQKQHRNIASGISDDMSLNYRERDNAFFNILQITQSLKSKVTFLSDYQPSLNMPNIRDRDNQITSILQRRDPKKTAYLMDFQEFIKDQAAHEKEIQRLNKWVIDIHDQIRAIVIPQTLYMLLVWMPLIFRLYRYFNSVNPLDDAIKQGSILATELDDLEKQIHTEDTRYYSRWQEKYVEYSALSMDPKKATAMLTEHEHFEKTLENQQALEAFIQSCNTPALQRAYQQFKRQPCYLNLFHLSTSICEYQYTAQIDKKDTAQAEKALVTIGELYPEISAALAQFSQETMQHISERNVFNMLEQSLEKNYATSKAIEDKIKKAKTEMGEVSKYVTQLRPNTDLAKIEQARARLQKLDAFIENGYEKLRRRRTFIEPFKHFLHNKSGETFKRFYWFVSQAENTEFHEYATILQSLYPASIAILEAEQEEIMLTINAQTGEKLQAQYLDAIIAIERSRNPKMGPFKEVATALKPLLGTLDWKWRHFTAIEQAIQKNPKYMENAQLAALVNQVISTIANAKKFVEVVERKPVRLATAVPELIINPNTALPTFFQTSSRNESAANTLIREILGQINLYGIKNSDRTLSNEEKQENIHSVCDLMLQYIDLLSADDTIQTISPEHLALLQNIATFVRQMSSSDLQIQLTAKNIDRIQSMLAQLDHKHPIRESTEFLIKTFQTKDEYITISTQYAQRQLHKDLTDDIRDQNRYEDRHLKRAKRSGSDLLSKEKSYHLFQWQIANSALKLIENYAAKLNQYPSPSSAEECDLVTSLSLLAKKIHHTLRHEPLKHREIPQILQQLEQHCESLRDHPISEVTQRMIHALKETEDYTKLSIPTASHTPGPKGK